MVFSISCSGLPSHIELGQRIDEFYGCELDASLSVDYIPQEEALGEDVSKSEAAEGIGLGITQQNEQANIEVAIVKEGSPAYTAGFEPGYVILVVDGRFFIDEVGNNIVDVNTAADMIKTGEVGSKVAILYVNSDFEWMRLAVCTRQ